VRRRQRLQWVLQELRGRPEGAAAEAEVVLAHTAGGELKSCCVVATVAASPDERSRSVLVQAVDEAMSHRRVARDRAEAAQPRGEPSLQLPAAFGGGPSAHLRTVLVVVRSSDRPASRLPEHAEPRLREDHRWLLEALLQRLCLEVEGLSTTVLLGRHPLQGNC